jgi:hypothetical protein
VVGAGFDCLAGTAGGGGGGGGVVVFSSDFICRGGTGGGRGRLVGFFFDSLSIKKQMIYNQIFFSYRKENSMQ